MRLFSRFEEAANRGESRFIGWPTRAASATTIARKLKKWEEIKNGFRRYRADDLPWKSRYKIPTTVVFTMLMSP